MKDVASNRHSRNSLIYPKKRPSPHGISKSHKSPLLPANGLARRTPRSTKVAIIQQKQREAQIQALRREGIFLEEEYREEIRYYMQDMEVSSMYHFFSRFYSNLFLEPLALYHVVYSVNGPTA
jgi:G2/mitotic-specific cyclin-B, other